MTLAPLQCYDGGMSSIVTRRTLLRGLLAAPAIVAASSLMPLRGIVMAAEPDMRVAGSLSSGDTITWAHIARAKAYAERVRMKPIVIDGKSYYAL